MSSDHIRQLFDRTLIGGEDDEQPWEAVRELQRLGTRKVFEIGAEWCRSADPLRRGRGADVLAQLGKNAGQASTSFPQEAYAVVAELVQTETEVRPLSAAIIALGHLENSDAVALAARHQAHPDSRVRYAVAFTLGSYPNEAESIAGLLQLTVDGDPEVRDWATFGLGVGSDADTPEIRDALAARLSDTNEAARQEAVSGLAKRQDQRSIPSLLECSQNPSPSVWS